MISLSLLICDGAGPRNCVLNGNIAMLPTTEGNSLIVEW